MPMLYPPSLRNKAFINGTLLKASKSKKILACPADPASPDRSDLVKIYFYPGLAPLKHIFRQSKASREYQVAKEIHKRGVPTILPERVQDIKKWGLLYHQSIVIAKLLPDYMNLEEFFSRQEAQDLHVRRAVIQQYAGLARTIHNQWIYQEDFSPYNILYQKKPGGFFQLYFLDFEKIRIDRELSRQERVRNLAKLNRSARVFKKTGDLNSSDQMRFLKAYLGPQAKKTNCGSGSVKSGRKRRKSLPGIEKGREKKAPRQAAGSAYSSITAIGDTIGSGISKKNAITAPISFKSFNPLKKQI